MMNKKELLEKLMAIQQQMDEVIAQLTETDDQVSATDDSGTNPPGDPPPTPPGTGH